MKLFSIKRRGFVVMLLLIVMLILTACVGDQYEKSDADQVKIEGQRMMTAFLSENVPGAKLISTENYIDYYPSGPRYLTDYVTGTYSTGSTTVMYAMNVANGKVYIEPPEDMANTVEAFVRSTLQLPADATISDLSYNLQLPASTEKTGKNRGHDYYPFALIPFGTTDLATYFEQEREETLEVDSSVHIPSKEPLDLTLKELIDLRTTAKIYFAHLLLTNDNHDSSSFIWNTASYEGAAYQDYQDFVVFTDTYYKYEKYDPSKNEIVVETDVVFDMEKDIKWEETESGYRITYLNNEFLHTFRIIAKEDSKIRQHDYTVAIGIEDDSESLYDEYDAYWETQDDGNTYLIREDGFYVEIYQYSELTFR